MERSETGGLIKQPKKTKQVKKNAEATVGSNNIARLFCMQVPKAEDDKRAEI